MQYLDWIYGNLRNEMYFAGGLAYSDSPFRDYIAISVKNDY